MKIESKSRDSLHLALGTISFTFCFAVWGLISAFAAQFRKLFGLILTQSAALMAAPVLLGSLARIPMARLAGKNGFDTL
jgi:NNP family nitrate/nitrite transporter-like MFS transporter